MDNPENEFILRYLSGIASEEERRTVEQWISHSPENECTLEQLYYIWQLTGRLKVLEQTDAKSALHVLKERIRRKEKSVRLKNFIRKFQRIAAILLLPSLLLSYYLFTELSQKEDDPSPNYVEIRTNPGMVTAVDLPDGSKVWINSKGYLRYPTRFSGGHREVFLNGEGYFKVSKNERKPFVVKVSERYKIQVLGTEFNVSAYAGEDKISTTLVSGAVQLDVFHSSGTKGQYKLSPNEKAVLYHDQLSIVQVDPIYETGWREGKLYFKNLPMDDVLKRLSRYYNVQFNVRNKQILESIITAKFENEQLPQVMEYIQLATGIKYKIRKPTISNNMLDTVVVELTK